MCSDARASTDYANTLNTLTSSNHLRSDKSDEVELLKATSAQASSVYSSKPQLGSVNISRGNTFDMKAEQRLELTALCAHV